MVNMTSLPASGTQNTSISCNVQQKKKYHELREALSTLDNDSMEEKRRVDTIKMVLKEVEALAIANTNNNNTSVALLDSRVLSQASLETLRGASKIEANSNIYNSKELAQHIASNPLWWNFNLPYRVPSAGTLHGAFEPTPPAPRVRAPRRRTQQQPLAAQRQPERIAVLEKPQEDRKQVRALSRWVRAHSRGGAPLSFWHCALHPSSFARTVQNVYHLSFLVQSGELNVYHDEALGIPMMRWVSSEDREPRDIAKENQFIVSIDMELWRKLVATCGITEPLMNTGE